MVVAIPCTVLFIIGLLTLAITVRGIIPWTHYHSLVFLELSVGLFGFVYSAGTMETYEVLVHNEKYSNSFWFKVKRKAKLKIDTPQMPVNKGFEGCLNFIAILL